MPSIAISSRRSDSAAITARIVDRLVANYGKNTIHWDVDDSPGGATPRAQIGEMPRGADVMLAIVGPDWFGVRPDGRERIQDEADPARIEIETALRLRPHRLLVIPVLIGSTRMPHPERLPPSLEHFAYLSAFKVDTGQDFDHHMDRLIKMIDLGLSQALKS